MKKVYLMLAAAWLTAASQAQTVFPGIIEPGKLSGSVPTQVVLPSSGLKRQVMFVGGTDLVAHKALAAKTVSGVSVYGQAAGTSVAKQWHDFIGFTPATAAERTAFANNGHANFLGWVSVNHEMIFRDNKLGDGGGMTVFAVKLLNDTLAIVPQDLSIEGFPTGSHKYFNVDFAGSVGETGMNCGGIVSLADGRIWTAEEWFRSSNLDKLANGTSTGSNGIFYQSGTSLLNNTPATGVADTTDFTITTGSFTGSDFQNQVVKKFQNFNWMVEIDPRKAKAIQKQYNWGRQGFEGGVLMPDNKTVYLGEDGSPGLFTKFIADVAGDFTKGKTYVYKWDNDNTPTNNWIEIGNLTLDSMLKITTYAYNKGATPFCRVEWVAANTITGKIYFTETGNDGWAPTNRPNATISKPMIDFLRFRKGQQGTDLSSFTDSQLADSLKAGRTNFRLNDYYGRITEYDPATGKIRTFLEGGPFLPSTTGGTAYPNKHLSNPDGIGTMYINNKAYLIIQEDLNGTTFARVPSEYTGSGNTICEMFLLDLSITNPTVNDLFKIAATPRGAEITGACAIGDDIIMFNSQHPATTNPFPENNSHTVALSGFRQAVVTAFEEPKFENKFAFEVFPNPTARELHLNKTSDYAIYNLSGVRVKVGRNSNLVDVSDLNSGTYIIMDEKMNKVKLIIE